MKNIVFDLDGTILEEDSSLSCQTIRCINDLSKNNIITIATGRSIQGLPSSILEIEKNIAFYITSNGTTIYDKERKPIYQDCIVSNNAICFIKDINRFEHVGLELLINGEWHIDNSGLDIIKKINLKSNVYDYIIKTRIVHDSLLKYIQENNLDIEKVSINFYEQDKRDALLEILVGFCKKYELRYFSDRPHKIDVFKKSISKGRALTFLSSFCGIGLNDTIAFGNDENDIEMFKACGESICMSSGLTKAKKCANIILRKNDSKRISRAIKLLKNKSIL